MGRDEQQGRLFHDTEVFFTRTRYRLDNIRRFLRKIMERQGAGFGHIESAPSDWNNPEWVSFQGAEILPLSPVNRQRILEMSVGERILEIDHVLSNNQP